MEHNQIRKILLNSRLGLSQKKTDLLLEYADMLHKKNTSFNLTGLKKLEDIVTNLIVESILTVKDINVPHGTFIDIGTGPGIPGIPLGIYKDNFNGILLDSNCKKIKFVTRVIRKLKLNNIKAVEGRAEDVCRIPEYRESFDFVFSRAFGNIYKVIELGSPLLKINGTLYIYSNRDAKELSSGILTHAEKLGLSIPTDNKYDISKGILFTKTQSTDPGFPRSYPVISRESKKINDWENH